MKQPGILLLSCLFLLSQVVLSRAADLRPIRIFFGNDLRGELEPCGCQSNQLGGLPKKAYQLEALRKNKPNLLAVDSGALLFAEPKIPQGQVPQLLETARGIASAYQLMSFAAVGIAPEDLAGGIDFLRDLEKNTKLPWLSANLVDTQGRHLFKPYRLITQAGLRIGLIGLTGTVPEEILLEGKAVLNPWEPALLEQLAQLQDKTELIILLSSLSPEENRKIASTRPEVHIILESGGERPKPLVPQRIGNSLLTRVEAQGKSVGLLDIEWNPRSREWRKAQEEKNSQKRNELDRLNWQINRVEKQGKPELLFEGRPEALESYRALLARRMSLQEEIRQLDAEEKKGAGEKGPPSGFGYRFLALDHSIPDDPKTRALVDACTREVNRIGRALSKSKADHGELGSFRPRGYAGSRTCKSCHESQFVRWRESRHAGAFESLVRRKQQFNPKCLPCHLTGTQEAAGEELLRFSGEFRGVGCESCHGPGQIHSGSPVKKNIQGRAEATRCLGCHSPDHDRDFDYTKKVMRLPRCSG